jgi:hypothetical protein
MTTFTASLAHIAEQHRAVVVEELAAALHAEFPAFRVAHRCLAGDSAVIAVVADQRTPTHAVERLHGWGHCELTITRTEPDVTCRGRQQDLPVNGVLSTDRGASGRP